MIDKARIIGYTDEQVRHHGTGRDVTDLTSSPGQRRAVKPSARTLSYNNNNNNNIYLP